MNDLFGIERTNVVGNNQDTYYSMPFAIPFSNSQKISLFPLDNSVAQQAPMHS